MESKIYRPLGAHEYLKERGIRASVGTLAKFRCSGKGPKFIKTGSQDVAYTQAALDDYVASRLSPEFTSTSAASEAKRLSLKEAAAGEMTEAR